MSRHLQITILVGALLSTFSATAPQPPLGQPRGAQRLRPQCEPPPVLSEGNRGHAA